MLPPGCARFETKPCSIGSETSRNTIGIELVARDTACKRRCRHYQVGRHRDQFFRVIVNKFWVAGAPPDVESEVLAITPAEGLQCLDENLRVATVRGFSRDTVHEHADAPHLLTLLRARCERPRPCAAEKGDELAPSHINPPVSLRAVRHSRCALK